MAPPDLLIYQVMHHEYLAKNISRVLLKSPTRAFISYQAGQYIHVVHHDQVESPMSIACAPLDFSMIELHLYHPPENRQALDMLRMVIEEKCLALRGPYGRCTASVIRLDRPVIFLANGTGFAPIKAVMEELLRLKKLPSLHLYWCADSQAELYLRELVVSWETTSEVFRFTAVEPQTMVAAVLEDYPDLSRCQVYAVETPDVVSSALDLFMRQGLDEKYFYSDVA